MKTIMRYTFALLTLLVISPAVGRASEIDALIDKLQGNDEQAKVYACHMLPYQSIDAVPKLLPLVAKDDENVWRPAYSVLADFVSAVSAAGREEERVVVTKHLMTLVAPEQNEATKIRGLKLLALAVPKGFDVGPVAALLDDAKLQDKARSSLQDMNTPESGKALCDYLGKAKPEFACSILDSLGFMKNAAAVEAVRAMTKNENAAVRASAARALAWTGDPVNLAIVQDVIKAANDATRDAATDALYRLLGAMAERGGNWQIAIDTYKDLLKTAKGQYLDAALAGLGQYGDGTCVKPILDVIKDTPVVSQRVGLRALEQLKGRDAARAIADSYAAAPEALKPGLVWALGMKKDALALPILKEAAASKDATLRLAAIEAFGEAGLPEGVAILSDAVQNGSDEEKAAAGVSLLSVAAELQKHNKKAEAGAAFAAVLAVAKDAEIRRVALAGVGACPTAGALDAAMKAADDAALAGPAMHALVSVGEALTAAKDKDKAMAAFDRLRRMNPSLETMTKVVQCMNKLGIKADTASLLGFITKWQVVGPFELGENNKGWDVVYVGEPKVDLKAEYASGGKKLAWKPAVAVDAMGKVDLRKSISDQDTAIGYAFAEITVEKDMDAVLKIGADDSERVWVNGHKVHEQFTQRGLTVDADKIPIKLKAGKNTILMKVWQNVMGWEFCARLATPDDRPVSFTQ